MAHFEIQENLDDFLATDTIIKVFITNILFLNVNFLKLNLKNGHHNELFKMEVKKGHFLFLIDNFYYITKITVPLSWSISSLMVIFYLIFGYFS